MKMQWNGSSLNLCQSKNYGGFCAWYVIFCFRIFLFPFFSFPLFDFSILTFYVFFPFQTDKCYKHNKLKSNMSWGKLERVFNLHTVEPPRPRYDHFVFSVHIIFRLQVFSVYTIIYFNFHCIQNA
jgi:hypothetical protein